MITINLALPDRNVLARFMEKVDKNGPIVRPELGPCWLWTAGLDRKGYGQFWLGRRTRTHRASYQLHVGRVPAGLHVLHHCDNRACVNPTHLHLGTNDLNVREKVERGRARGGGMQGEKHPHAKLTEAQVREMRELREQGWLLRELSARFGLGVAHISYIVRGKAWGHV